jgi:phage host-nuclease inhibitor protein Gam
MCNQMSTTDQPALTPEQESILQSLIEAGQDPDEAREWVTDYVVSDESKPVFMVKDMSSANWVLKKLAECDAEEAEVMSMVEAEIETIRKRAERLIAPIARKRMFFKTAYLPQLEEWAKSKLEGQKAKSVKLVHGTVGFRRSPEKLVIDDEDKAIQIIEEHYPASLRIKKEIDKKQLKVDMEAFGETEICVNDKGVKRTIAHIEPGADTFYVKPEMPAAEVI